MTAPTHDQTSFRARIILAVAVAFAVAVVVASAAAYVGVRSALRGDVDAGLRARVERVVEFRPEPGLNAGPVVADLAQRRSRLGPPEVYIQVLNADGTVTKPPGEPAGLPVSDRARAVAAGTAGAYFSDATVGGAHVRVVTAPLREGVAVQAARPVGDLDRTLHHLGRHPRLRSPPAGWPWPAPSGGSSPAPRCARWSGCRPPSSTSPPPTT